MVPSLRCFQMGVDKMWTPLLDPESGPHSGPVNFLYDCPCENLCKCSVNANAFVSPENAGERTLQWPCRFFSDAPSFFFRTHLRFLAAGSKHFGNRNVSVCRGGRAGSITIVVLPLSALMELQISCLKKSETGPLLFLLQCETRAKEKTKT